MAKKHIKLEECGDTKRKKKKKKRRKKVGGGHVKLVRHYAIMAPLSGMYCPFNYSYLLRVLY